MRVLKPIALLTMLAIVPAGVMAGAVTVPMKDKGADTFYVDVHVEGFGNIDYLVDTGAGYMTINEDTLAVLRARDQATYVRRLRGILADGSTLVVPVYRIGSINIGGVCKIDDVEAAVFPGASRSLLGLSALRKAAPLMFSIDPPILRMSNCVNPAAPPADVQDVTHEKAPSVPPVDDMVRADR